MEEVLKLLSQNPSVIAICLALIIILAFLLKWIKGLVESSKADREKDIAKYLEINERFAEVVSKNNVLIENNNRLSERSMELSAKTVNVLEKNNIIMDRLTDMVYKATLG